MRAPSIGILLLLVGCAALPPPAPGDVPFARALVARSSAVAAAPAPTREVTESETPLSLPTRAAAVDGTVPEARLAALRPIAGSEDALARFLEDPVTPDDLAALVVLRSPDVRAARSLVGAAGTAYRQSADLADLVAVYRSFGRDTATRVGPERSRRQASLVAPSPNVSSLSGDLARRTEAMAFEDLRATIVEKAAAAERAHADAARLAEARRIVAEDVALSEALLTAARARYEAGQTSQAGYLALRARLAELRAELKVLDAEVGAVRARLNRLLGRPEGAAVNLDLAFGETDTTPADLDAPRLMTLALESRPSHRKAVLAADRAGVAVRLAETMTLPRLDLGSSRFERERAGEAGVARGPVFPEPGRMVMHRADFGVREAQVEEVRSRRDAAVAGRDASRDRVSAEVRRALVAVESARRRRAVRAEDMLPLAEKSLAAVRGAYEGNRAGYLDLLDASRRLLRARLGLADARRDLAHAHADLLIAVGARTEKER